MEYFFIGSAYVSARMMGSACGESSLPSKSWCEGVEEKIMNRASEERISMGM
jgi:hypothetical protein